jgi:hypothetical protein
MAARPSSTVFGAYSDSHYAMRRPTTKALRVGSAVPTRAHPFSAAVRFARRDRVQHLVSTPGRRERAANLSLAGLEQSGILGVLIVSGVLGEVVSSYQPGRSEGINRNLFHPSLHYSTMHATNV